MNKYNLSKFNIASGTGEDIPFMMYCREYYEALITFGINTIISMSGTENIDNRVLGAISVPFLMDNHGTINLTANLQGIVVIEFAGHEVINFNANMLKNIYGSIFGLEELSFNSYMSNDIKFEIENSENISSIMDIYKNISYGNTFINENLMTSFRTTILNTQMFKININLLPGQTIEIDSDIFSAYIDDINVIDKFTGDWINIDKNITSLEIASGTGGKLEGKILYRERFL